MNRQYDDMELVRAWLHQPTELAPTDIDALMQRVETTSRGRRLPAWPDTWRFHTMFSATKYVVAGVVFALFGGLLLAGLSFQVANDDPVPPPAATASINTDILPGVELRTEEVRPGVSRIVHDGERDLTRNLRDLAITREGDVWVERHLHGFSGTGDGIGATQRNIRVSRLGNPESHRFARFGGFRQLHDGTIAVNTDGELRTFDGERWGRPRSVGNAFAPMTDDGSRWEMLRPPGGVRRTDAKGNETRFANVDIGVDDETSLAVLRAGPDGALWIAHGHFDPDAAFTGLARYDGAWSVIPVPGRWDRRSWPVDLVFDASGTAWVTVEVDDGFTAATWDGTDWRWHEMAVAPAYGGARLDSDGRPWWFGGNTMTTVVDDELVSIEILALDSASEPSWEAGAFTPDGSLWLLIMDMDPRRAGCPPKAVEHRECPGITDGLYVFTPEALALELSLRAVAQTP